MKKDPMAKIVKMTLTVGIVVIWIFSVIWIGMRIGKWKSQRKTFWWLWIGTNYNANLALFMNFIDHYAFNMVMVLLLASVVLLACSAYVAINLVSELEQRMIIGIIFVLLSHSIIFLAAVCKVCSWAWFGIDSLCFFSILFLSGSGDLLCSLWLLSFARLVFADHRLCDGRSAHLHRTSDGDLLFFFRSFRISQRKAVGYISLNGQQRRICNASNGTVSDPTSIQHLKVVRETPNEQTQNFIQENRQRRSKTW